jgi:transposase InsO family protein
VKIASSTYYAALTRLKSAREIRNEELTRVIQRVYDENYKVYGARKMWCELHREGIGVGRCRAERLMRNMGLVRNNGSGRRGPRGSRYASLCPIRTILGPLSWRNVSSRRKRRTGCGWRISPMFPPGGKRVYRFRD